MHFLLANKSADLQVQQSTLALLKRIAHANITYPHYI